jgi:hypothetical protein
MNHQSEKGSYLSGFPDLFIDLGFYSPISTAYKSAVAFVNQSNFSDNTVTKEDYQEYGSNACIRKFRSWRVVDDVEPRDRSRNKPDAGGPATSTKKVNRTRSRSTLVPVKS